MKPVPDLPQERLLRPRGDRPTHNTQQTTRNEASPPTRRSTRSMQMVRIFLTGFSAHAEIDPSQRPPRTRCWRLLRPRGDRPERRVAFGRNLKASPPTRRSTHEFGLLAPRVSGFSAHAEIDPDRTGDHEPIDGLLRPRGDRPGVGKIGRRQTEASPPTRRSTPIGRRCDSGHAGFSAHAEIDPIFDKVAPHLTGLLRPRGEEGINAARMGFSAHEEIDPNGTTETGRRSGLLRPRGDRPCPTIFSDAGREASPPTRRSTPAVQDVERYQEGFSAHAEIDP